MFNPQKILELENERKNSDSDFTVSELLRFIPLTAPAYRDIKEGKSMPKVSILERIAIFYGVDMNCFFTQFTTTQTKKKESKQQVELKIESKLLIKRVEEQAVKINKLEEELAVYKGGDKSYTLQNVSDYLVAESTPKLNKTHQEHTNLK